jgi:two-component system, LytTR family, response regulator
MLHGNVPAQSAPSAATMKLRTIIIDNERVARQRLRRLLAAEEQIDVVAECADGPSLLNIIEECRPELLLLDIQMPEMDGFEILERIDPRPLPLVVFVTGFDQHAVRAFDTCAVDYLLKPVSPDRLHHALARVRKNLSLLRGRSNATRPAEPVSSRRFSVRSGQRTSFIAPEEIDWIECAGNYAVLHVGNRNHLLRETMSALERQLPSRRFLRVSRSAILHLTRVKELQTVPHGQHCAILDSGERVSLTRSIREVEERLRELPAALASA